MTVWWILKRHPQSSRYEYGSLRGAALGPVWRFGGRVRSALCLVAKRRSASMNMRSRCAGSRVSFVVARSASRTALAALRRGGCFAIVLSACARRAYADFSVSDHFWRRFERGLRLSVETWRRIDHSDFVVARSSWRSSKDAPYHPTP